MPKKNCYVSFWTLWVLLHFGLVMFVSGMPIETKSHGNAQTKSGGNRGRSNAQTTSHDSTSRGRSNAQTTQTTSRGNGQTMSHDSTSRGSSNGQTTSHDSTSRGSSNGQTTSHDSTSRGNGQTKSPGRSSTSRGGSNAESTSRGGSNAESTSRGGSNIHSDEFAAFQPLMNLLEYQETMKEIEYQRMELEYLRDLKTKYPYYHAWEQKHIRPEETHLLELAAGLMFQEAINNGEFDKMFETRQDKQDPSKALLHSKALVELLDILKKSDEVYRRAVVQLPEEREKLETAVARDDAGAVLHVSRTFVQK